MKRTLYFLIAVLLLASCEKEQKRSSFNTPTLEMYADGEYSLTVINDVSGTKFASSNEYVAQVSQTGVISSNYIGKVTITKGDARCELTVKPRYSTYTEPVIEWGLSKSSIISKVGSSYSFSNGVLTYQTGNKKAPQCMYSFDSNSKLTASAVSVYTTYTSELTEFLLERYKPYTYSPEDYMFVFIDGLTTTTAKNIIVLSIYNAAYIFVMYTDIDDIITSSGALQNIDKLIEEKSIQFLPHLNYVNQDVLRQGTAVRIENLLTH